MAGQGLPVFRAGFNGITAKLDHRVYGGQNILRRHIAQDIVDSGKDITPARPKNFDAAAYILADLLRR